MESIVFAESENDTAGNKDSFKVWRVYRSPYLFEVKHTVVGENAKPMGTGDGRRGK